MIEAVAPNVACAVLDWAIQAHGGGMCDDFPLAYAYTRRLADGADPVHRNAVAKHDIAKHVPLPAKEGAHR